MCGGPFPSDENKNGNPDWEAIMDTRPLSERIIHGRAERLVELSEFRLFADFVSDLVLNETENKTAA